MARARETPRRPGSEDWDADHWLDPPPVPEASEGGESVWQLWQEESRRLDLAFAPTQPSGMGPLDEPAQPESVHPPASADELMVVARRHNRVCPQPDRWAELYARLGGDRYADLEPPPVQPWMWSKVSALQKRLRLRSHLEWAERHAKLGDAAAFLLALDEEEWLHMGERPVAR